MGVFSNWFSGDKKGASGPTGPRFRECLSDNYGSTGSTGTYSGGSGSTGTAEEPFEILQISNIDYPPIGCLPPIGKSQYYNEIMSVYDEHGIIIGNYRKYDGKWRTYPLMTKVDKYASRQLTDLLVYYYVWDNPYPIAHLTHERFKNVSY